jgi:hypothetical protein
MTPTISLTKTSSAAALQARLGSLNSLTVYVGIPPSATASQRRELLESKSNKIKSTRKKSLQRKRLLIQSAQGNVSNATLLYWFSKGTRSQPARPVIEPALRAPGTKETIAKGFSEAMELQLDGKNYAAKQRLKKVATVGKNASKDWFFSPNNNWAPNAYRTTQHKDSDLPGIATGAMREAIQGWVE